MKNNKPTRLGFSIAIALFGSMLILSGCTRVTIVPPVVTQFEPFNIPRIDPYLIYYDYEHDPIAADNLYKGKIIWLVDIVLDDYVPSQDEPSLVIGTITTQFFRYDYEYFGYFGYFRQIKTNADGTPEMFNARWCFITENSANQHNKGDMVEIIGRCDGMQEQGVVFSIDWIIKTGSGSVRDFSQTSGY
jgi:hypothetical protein